MAEFKAIKQFAGELPTAPRAAYPLVNIPLARFLIPGRAKSNQALLFPASRILAVRRILRARVSAKTNFCSGRGEDDEAVLWVREGAAAGTK